MNQNIITHIQNQIGYTFKNQELLVQAFTRRSYSSENGGENNEVLEFIGDKALDIAIVKLLSERFGHFTKQVENFNNWGRLEETGPYHSELNEGELTNIKARLVQKETLAKAIYNLDFEPYLIMSDGDKKNKVENSNSVKEDLFEAIIGAIALDSGWNIETIQSSVEVMLNPDDIIYSEDINYVTEVQEWALNNSGSVPILFFHHTSQSTNWYIPPNPTCLYGDVPADTHYACELILEEIDYHFIGYGRSQSLAKSQASKLAYEYLEKNGLLFSIKDEIDNPSKNLAINQLEILARRGYFSIPQYSFSENHDNNGNPIWKCVCRISEKEKTFSSSSTVKREAKKAAAWKMLQYVLKDI